MLRKVGKRLSAFYLPLQTLTMKGMTELQRKYNFAAGPAAMPLPVLEEIQRDLTDYKGMGLSVMEMSHRSKAFGAIIRETEAALRRLMKIPEEYAVLFLQGGASLQFSMIPMNLARRGAVMDYALTGQFARKAWEEGKRWGDARAITDGKAENYTHITPITPDMLDRDAAFLHITANNTIYGTAWNTLPETGNIPLVGDLSSIILGREYDINRFGLIYAGAQKNMGPAGLTVVIVRRDLIPKSPDPIIPTMLQYGIMEKNDSMYNTPPTFAIYVAGLVYRWVEEQGGVAAMEKRNAEKAKLLYDTIDRSAIFTGTACAEDRSPMNVTFTLPDEEMTADFLLLAEHRGLLNLKGHRAVGGCRASLYNAVPLEAVQALTECMKDFEKGMRI